MMIVSYGRDIRVPAGSMAGPLQQQQQQQQSPNHLVLRTYCCCIIIFGIVTTYMNLDLSPLFSPVCEYFYVYGGHGETATNHAACNVESRPLNCWK